MKFSLPRHALRCLRKFTTVLAGILPALNAVSQSTGVVGWGFNNNGQANAQIGLTDVIGVTAGGGQSFALRGNATVVTWGFPLNPPMPPGLRDISVIEAGRAHLLAIRSNGTVVAWGENTSGETTIPSGLSNVVAVSGGPGHSLAVTSDGTVSAWGNNSLGQSTVPAGLSNVIAVSAGGNASTAYSVALKSDGTVVAWGDNRLRQTQVPPGLSNVVAIEASPFIHTVALKSDGTVAVWGVGLLTTNVPRGLTNVVAISAGSGYSLALRADGTIVGWGDNSENELNVPPSARNVSAIASGWFHNVAVVRSSPPRWPRISQQPLSQRTLAGQPVMMSVSATSAAPITYRWQFRGRAIPGATNAVLHLESPQLSEAGDYAVVVSADGLSVRSAPAFLAVSDPPVAVSGEFTGLEDKEMILTAGGFDPSGLPLTARILGLPPTGFIYQFQSGGRGSRIETVPTIVTDAERRILFVPEPNVHGSKIATIEFALSNEIGDSAPAELFISLEPVNDPPVAEGGSVLANEDAAIPIVLRAHDVDGETVVYTVGRPAHGSLNGVPPNLVYRPAADYFGPDSFTFSVNDGQASSGTATVSLTILSVDDPPVARAGATSPTFYSSADPAHVVVLAPDNAGAIVFLDGSLSEDVENNPLEFFWFEFEEAIPFATGVRVTNNLEVGQHSIVLRVSDGNGVATTSVTIEVITPGEAIDEILPMFVNEPGLRGKGRPMVASLKAAIASFDRGNTEAGLNQLHALQNKIRAQIGRGDPALAEELLSVVQRIAEVLD